MMAHRFRVIVVVCFVTTIAAALDNQECRRLDPAPVNFAHLGPEWSGRCVALYVSLSARPAGGGSVCGTDVFSAESDLVAAAIHAGLFSGYSFAATTVVTFLPGRPAYRGSRRYGVQSHGTCGPSRLSFAFPTGQFPPPPVGPQELAFYAGMLATFSVVGARVAGGVVGGSVGGVYSQASDPGAAAAHAGLAKPGETRVLRIWYLPRHPTEADLDAFGFPDAPEVMYWGEAPRSLDEFLGADGVSMRFRLTCCSAGQRMFATVRGSDIYHVASSFAASALHAGVIRVGEARSVEVEFVGKRASFPASYRNGVMSERAGRGDGYRFLSPKVAM